MNYPGGKNGSGVYQQIINQIPPHEQYVELFAGGAAILRKKRPAAVSIAMDVDASAVEALRRSPEIPLATNIFVGDALDWLFAHGESLTDHTVIYADPPYILHTRSASKEIYANEYHREDQHIEWYPQPSLPASE